MSSRSPSGVPGAAPQRRSITARASSLSASVRIGETSQSTRAITRTFGAYSVPFWAQADRLPGRRRKIERVTRLGYTFGKRIGLTMAVEVTMPKFGLTMHEGTIQRFFKQPGDQVSA